MNIKSRRHRASALGAIASIIAIASPTAAIAEVRGADPISPIAAIEAVVPEALESSGDSELTDNGQASTNEDVDVFLPSGADEPISVGWDERELIVSLPFADVAESQSVVEGEPVTFDNQNGSASVPVAREDGALQIFTVIEVEKAPTRYTYNVDVPTGGSSLTLLENGGVVILNNDGGFEGVIDAPWAKDANGVSVPTHFEISGNELTQVVEHDGTQAYPIVADPYMGLKLFDVIIRYIENVGHDYKYSGIPSGPGIGILWGGGGPGQLMGQQIFRNEGWAEWKKAYPGVTNKATLKQQYDCHVMAGAYGLVFTGPYDIERYRSNKPNWLAGIVSHKCNWK